MLELKSFKFQLLLKRIFDLISSFFGLLLLMPILAIISIVIKLDSKGTVFFRQVRIGKDEREFKIFKFRTMEVETKSEGMQITVGKDKRITKSGYFLRKTKLDELPQLINVLLGNMSFVGPRPEVPKYVAMYDKNQKSILKVKPGITDIASIYFRNECDILAYEIEPEKAYVEKIMPFKIELNNLYISNINIRNDIKIIYLTIYAVISGKAPSYFKEENKINNYNNSGLFTNV